MSQIFKYGSIMGCALLLAVIGGCGSDSGPEDVVLDTDPPNIEQVTSITPTELRVVFDEPVDRATAEDHTNYLIVRAPITPSSARLPWQGPGTTAPGDSLQATGASLDPDGRTVVVATEEMDAFDPYELYVARALDSSGNQTASSQVIVNRMKSKRIFTVAGTGLPGKGGENMDPRQTELYLPMDMTNGPDGLLYVVDWNNHRIRVIEDGLIRTIIGTGQLGGADPPPEGGDPLAISLNHPTHIMFDPLGRLCMAAWHNAKILRMTLDQTLISEICSNTGIREYSGDGGPALTAEINIASSTAFSPIDGFLYLSDQGNQRVRVIDDQGVISTVVGNGSTQRENPTANTGFFRGGYCGDGNPAIDACLNNPVGQAADPGGKITFDAAGNLYIVDTWNHCIRKVDTNGIITTFAGTPTVSGSGGDGGAATAAQFASPSDIAISPDGEFYIADRRNHVIRKIDKNGVITTVAGQIGQFGFLGDGDRATDAKLRHPYGVDFDAQGNLYIADTHNHRLRVVYK